MLGRKDYPEPGGGKMLEVQLAAAAVNEMRRSVWKAQTQNLGRDVAVRPIQDGFVAKRLNTDRRKIRKLMRWRQDRDIALFKQRPIVDARRHFLHIPHEGNVDVAFEEKIHETVRWFLSEFDMETRHELADFDYRLENERGGYRRSETDDELGDLLLLKLPRTAPDCFRRRMGALKQRKDGLPQFRQMCELSLTKDELPAQFLFELLHALRQRRLSDVA